MHALEKIVLVQEGFKMEKYCIFTEEKKFTLASVEVKDGRFSAIHKERELSEEEAFSCPEDFLLPGLIDIIFTAVWEKTFATEQGTPSKLWRSMRQSTALPSFARQP